jgi:hypothetical protein
MRGLCKRAVDRENDDKCEQIVSELRELINELEWQLNATRLFNKPN